MRRQFDPQKYAEARRQRTFVSALIILILIPLTIFAGIKFLDDRKYLIISLLIIFYIMTPFFLVFEKRKPKAGEIVMIGVMSAMTTVGNLSCYMVTPFQPGTAMVMITGIAFGPEAGFLCGALARFISNFFQGQGPWTPWQMFCWGILGFISGIVFNKDIVDQKKSRNFKMILGPVLSIGISILVAYILHLLWGKGTFLGWKLYVFGATGLIIGILVQRKRLPIDDITLSVYAFFMTFIIYGGIMNIAAMVMASALPDSGITISFKSLAILYISGVPYDGVHALGSAFFMFVMGEKIIKKMERVKIKYGLYD